MDDKERMAGLVRQAKNGDAHSFALLYEMIYADLYRAALYMLNNPEDAENIVGDTVLDAYAGITKLRDETAFRGWIFRILSNKCKRMMKEYISRRENQTTVSMDELSETVPDNRIGVHSAENKTVAEQAFSILSDEEKEIVALIIYGEYDSGEVAEQMNMNRNTVRSKYSRALSKMRDFIGSLS